MSYIGRHRLIRVLGSGAFATVWLARDEDLDIDVAIKVLAENWSTDAGVRERFLHEARLLRRISSPRVVRVHDVGVHDDQPYFVMDYLAHGTLADVGPHSWSTESALWLGAQAAFATQVLHDAGVLHRDIKPSNLLLGNAEPKPSLLVTDLGLAKGIAEGSGYTVMAGTPAYTAPEQARGGTLDARTDVYSLAVVTYELLSGRRPYPVVGMGEVPVQNSTGSSLPATGLSVTIDALLDAALALDPESRPASAAQFGHQLLDLLAETGSTALTKVAHDADPSGRKGAATKPPSSPASIPVARLPTRLTLLLTLLAFLCAAVAAYLITPA